VSVPTPPNLPLLALTAAAFCLLLSQTAARADLIVPDDYATIAAALAAIESGVETDRVITVEPGTFTETITLSATLPSGVVLRGRETARTILNGTLTSNAPSVRISNFSFTGPGPAVRVVSGGATISANVFRLASGATAIAITEATPDILNNLFWRGGVAVDAGSNAITLENNAFYQNSDTLIAEGPGSSISHNAFFGVEPFGADAVTGDPLFTDPDRGDYHLRADSPLIDAGAGTDSLDGTAGDIGAYGGSHAEGRPFPVQGLEIVAVESDGLDHRVTLRWAANQWYRLGGYRVHYDDDGGAPYDGTGADEGDSPIDAGQVTTFTVGGLDAAAPGELGTPVLEPPEPGDRRLLLRWSEVPGATGYVVRYRVDGEADETEIDAGAVTQFTLTGLENGTEYRIHVAAYAERNYVFAVTAYPGFNVGLQSAFSAQVAAAIGPRVEGLPSNEVVDFPEAIVAFPNLPDDNGCFIATAAFGFYGAAEVRTLRRFRDDFLLTHAPGRAFVAWYYRHSPRWAEALHERPALKPLARIALLPMIVMAALMVQAPPALKWAIMCLAIALAAGAARRRMMTDTGDLR
jgi:hypothetical protein